MFGTSKIKDPLVRVRCNLSAWTGCLSDADCRAERVLLVGQGGVFGRPLPGRTAKTQCISGRM